MNCFDDYVSYYDMSIEQIKYKYHHSYRVMINMEIIAKKLNMNDYDVELAKCIGLLHDIGRFDQYMLFQSFDDKNLDHGDYGEQVIKIYDLLKHFNIDSKDYDVVYTAIRNHNKYSIEPYIGERELLFSKMIRDADKLDILYALGRPELKNIIREDESEISPKIKESFYKNEPVKNTDKQSLNDNIIILLAFPYDIYFDISMSIIKNKKYYEKIYNRLENKEKFKEFLNHIEKYIKERVD